MAKSNIPTIKLSLDLQNTFFFDGEFCSDTVAIWQKDSVRISNTKIQTLVNIGLPFSIRQGRTSMGEEDFPPIAKIFEETIQQADYYMLPLFTSTQDTVDNKPVNLNLFQHNADSKLFGLRDPHYSIVDLNSEILSTGQRTFVCNNKTVIIAPFSVPKENGVLKALYHALQLIYKPEQPTT